MTSEFTDRCHCLSNYSGHASAPSSWSKLVLLSLMQIWNVWNVSNNMWHLEYMMKVAVLNALKNCHWIHIIFLNRSFWSNTHWCQFLEIKNVIVKLLIAITNWSENRLEKYTFLKIATISVLLQHFYYFIYCPSMTFILVRLNFLIEFRVQLKV